MGNVSIIDPVKDLRWDRFVENHPLGWISHLSCWKEVLEKTFNHIEGHYLVLEDDKSNAIQAALPVFVVKSWLLGDRLVSIPFATLCDPLVGSVEEFKTLLDAATVLRDKLGCRHLEIRAFRGGEFITRSRMCLRHHYKHHFLALNRELEELMKGFHRTCVRQPIRRAQEANIRVDEGGTEKDLMQFYWLHLKTRRSHLLPLQPYRFLRNLWQQLGSRGYLRILLAKYDDRAIAGLVLLQFKDRVSAEFAASDKNFLDLCPNHLLFWTAIQKARAEGSQVFDFGRTAPDNSGLMDFKRRWGTELVDLIEAFRPVDAAQRNYDYRTFGERVFATVCRVSPVSAYRALSDFCYRHVG